VPTLSAFTFGTRLPGTVASVRPAVEAALKAEGFGILTEIDVQATMKEKLGVDRAPYVILGVLREDGRDTIVEAMDPMAALGIVDAPGIRPVAEEAKARLERAIAALEMQAG
jgi:uncharacterized protein (DUF302 family)